MLRPASPADLSADLPSMSADPRADRVVYLGHGSVLLEQDQTRLITDPVLRGRMGHLTRRVEPIEGRHAERLDAVLISHVHQDHMDLPSLRRLPGTLPVVVPPGAARLAARAGFDDVRELAVGESTRIGPLSVEAVPAAHPGRRPPLGTRAEAVGYIVTGANRSYFAGDTDLFEGMGELGSTIDLALLPIAGWGPRVGTGHLNSTTAAEALRLLRPRIAVPIHWGTFYPVYLLRSRRLVDPPLEFARNARARAPEVDVRVLQPGDATEIERR
jgi:L-ascorbate metabolism protein UlaG (beta-lactamase superfamily)